MGVFGTILLLGCGGGATRPSAASAPRGGACRCDHPGGRHHGDRDDDDGEHGDRHHGGGEHGRGEHVGGERAGDGHGRDQHADDGSRYQHGGHDPHHRFDDPEQWAERFEATDRDAWQKPEVVIELLTLGRRSIVADIGSATGYFPTRIAGIVSQGRVWGVDIEPAMVRYLNDRARREDRANLFSILGSATDPLLPEACDRVLVVNTYHHIEDRPAYFRRVRERLRPGGLVVIVDFKAGDLPVGPPEAMKIPAEVVSAEMASAGFELAGSEHERLPYQFALVFRAAAAEAAAGDDTGSH